MPPRLCPGSFVESSGAAGRLSKARPPRARVGDAEGVLGFAFGKASEELMGVARAGGRILGEAREDHRLELGRHRPAEARRRRLGLRVQVMATDLDDGAAV